MRIIVLSCAILGFTAQVHAQSTKEPPSLARCSPAKQPGSCRISWDFSSEPRTHYWVQQYDVQNHAWRSLEEPSVDPTGISKDSVRGGSLYRIQACNDLAAKTDCVSSTVYWAPIWFDRTDSIPLIVTNPTRDGSPFVVSKNVRLEDQLLQYNVYRVVQECHAIGADLASLPPMTKPPPDDVDPSMYSYADMVHINVYSQYEASRELAIKAAGRR